MNCERKEERKEVPNLLTVGEVIRTMEVFLMHKLTKN